MICKTATCETLIQYFLTLNVHWDRWQSFKNITVGFHLKPIITQRGSREKPEYPHLPQWFLQGPYWDQVQYFLIPSSKLRIQTMQLTSDHAVLQRHVQTPWQIIAGQVPKNTLNPPDNYLSLNEWAVKHDGISRNLPDLTFLLHTRLCGSRLIMMLHIRATAIPSVASRPAAQQHV